MCMREVVLFLYLGGLAVTFFFVLSGFLITYLLLIERDTKGTINIKNFYLRRVLRIWPVYYVIFVIGFLILPRLILPEVLLPKTINSENYWNSFFFKFSIATQFF